MDPVEQWKVSPRRSASAATSASAWRTIPSSRPDEYARSNAELVEKIVRIARDLGRDIATPDETRGVLGIDRRKAA